MYTLSIFLLQGENRGINGQVTCPKVPQVVSQKSQNIKPPCALNHQCSSIFQSLPTEYVFTFQEDD